MACYVILLHHCMPSYDDMIDGWVADSGNGALGLMKELRD
jgi:hypothetical protein